VSFSHHRVSGDVDSDEVRCVVVRLAASGRTKAVEAPQWCSSLSAIPVAHLQELICSCIAAGVTLKALD